MKSSTLAFVCMLAIAGCAPGLDTPEPWPQGRIIDLTHGFDESTIYWPTADGFRLIEQARGWQQAGYYYEANAIEAAEHGGTHLDAPVHFAEGQWSADEIPLNRLIGPGILIDVSEKALLNRDYLISIGDFHDWEAIHGILPEGIIVLLRTGFGAFWSDRERYMGTDLRGAEAVAELHFPGLDPEAARWLAAERSISAIGLDTPSIDYGQSGTFEAHQALFVANIPVFENVANLDSLPATGFDVIALPMKINRGSGGPLRIVAIVR